MIVFFEFSWAPKPRGSPNLFQKTRGNKLPQWQIRLINLEQSNCHLFARVSDNRVSVADLPNIKKSKEPYAKFKSPTSQLTSGARFSFLP